jgi:predicted nucleotidyltransferase component of viral defense system
LTDIDVEASARAAFRELQHNSRKSGANMQALLTVYAVESFLRRLATSEHAQQLVLKGGMLMAAHSIRRMTRDADLSAHGVRNDERGVARLVATISATEPDPHDGITIDPESLRTQVMREDAEYRGVRCKLNAHLAQALIPFALDFSFGDPRSASLIQLESVISRPAIALHAYPLTLNLAEKLVTAMQRRETSTRDRDLADIWVTSRRQRVDARELHGHVAEVAENRGQRIIPMAQALEYMPDRQQPYTAMVQRMGYLSAPPASWSDLLAGVIGFADPLLLDTDGTLAVWEPEQLVWK